MEVATKQILVPELRFPQFTESWHNIELNKAVTINPKNSELPNSFIYVDLESVNNGHLLKEERLDKQDAPSRAQRLLKQGDILYQTVRPYQKNNYYFDKAENDYVASTGYAQIRTENNSKYIFQYIHTDYFVNKVLLRCTGTSYPAINSTDLSKIKINLPPLPEQQKIEAFLTKVDDKIAQLTKKAELLEQYKKGVMQKIFKQELRFKDDNGKEFSKWEKKKLGDLATRVKDKNSDNSINYVLTNSATQGVVSQTDYFDKDIANQGNLDGYYIVDKDDFVYNPRVSVHAPVGPIKRNKLAKGVMSPLYSVFRFKDSNLEYFEYYFETAYWHKYLVSVANIGARHDRMNILTSDFYNMPIPYPCEAERLKITKFLKNLSDKIEQVNTQLTQAKIWKKGLLQKMFV
ncbi:restriction endonuclease subunit S [Flexithrix dorotheae]|uniref:restriction endonuclease subunit S n=1 Tax=Flexithrix dorotheae TaxID=70993 RepID=UPI000372C5DB|nr:restriction endonuclease subunit S [Flexithrix dorotheae]